MGRSVGTVSRGIRIPIIRRGDNIQEIVVESLLKACKTDSFELKDRDVLGLTESIVARAQGNFAPVNAITSDLKAKYSGKSLGIIFPMLSRNRFSLLLKAIARSTEHLYIQFSYPSDEVGNQLVSVDILDEKGINPWSDCLSEEEFTQTFGPCYHPFTGIDYIDYYRKLVEAEGTICTIIFSNDPRSILAHCKEVLACDIHSRLRTKKKVMEAGAERAYSLDQILAEPINGSGYHAKYGVLGSNKSDEETIKLFPRDCQAVVDGIQKRLFEISGKQIEVMVYGDGAFKDPVGQIWELADPVVSPAYTAGLEGNPNELKIKYLADSKFAELSGENLQTAIVDSIKHKVSGQASAVESLGTTPRRLTDLLGSLCDLTSGSGDKGTPVVHVQGYFDSLASD